jgi:hypothetical protein
VNPSFPSEESGTSASIPWEKQGTIFRKVGGWLLIGYPGVVIGSGMMLASESLNLSPLPLKVLMQGYLIGSLFYPVIYLFCLGVALRSKRSGRLRLARDLSGVPLVFILLLFMVFFISIPLEKSWHAQLLLRSEALERQMAPTGDKNEEAVVSEDSPLASRLSPRLVGTYSDRHTFSLQKNGDAQENRICLQVLHGRLVWIVSYRNSSLAEPVSQCCVIDDASGQASIEQFANIPDLSAVWDGSARDVSTNARSDRRVLARCSPAEAISLARKSAAVAYGDILSRTGATARLLVDLDRLLWEITSPALPGFFVEVDDATGVSHARRR